MSIKLKLLKSKTFNVGEAKHTHYSVAYKGRIFGVNTLKYEDNDIKVENDTLVINTDVEVIQETSIDNLTGETRNFLSIVPKLDIAFAAF